MNHWNNTGYKFSQWSIFKISAEKLLEGIDNKKEKKITEYIENNYIIVDND